MDIHYRPYINDDLEQCTALAIEAWPVAAFFGKYTHSIMKAYVEISLSFSDYSEVCCVNSKVAGLLFGMTEKTLPSLKESFGVNKMFWEFILGKYGKPKRRLRFLLSFIQTLFKVEFYCRKLDSEVELFIVGEEHRGQGFGRALMDHFISHLREKNKKTAYVYTNPESTWIFYEKYGFIKQRDFYDNSISFMKGSKTDGYIYYYEL